MDRCVPTKLTTIKTEIYLELVVPQMHGIRHDAKEYKAAKAMRVEPTELQNLAFELLCQVEALEEANEAKKKKKEESDAEKRAENEGAEVTLHLRGGEGDHGVSIHPSAGMDPTTTRALQNLRGQPGAGGKYLCVIICCAKQYHKAHMISYILYYTSMDSQQQQSWQSNQEVCS